MKAFVVFMLRRILHRNSKLLVKYGGFAKQFNAWNYLKNTIYFILKNFTMIFFNCISWNILFFMNSSLFFGEYFWGGNFYLPFAYVFNKFEILSGITICSAQYILDNTISFFLLILFLFFSLVFFYVLEFRFAFFLLVSDGVYIYLVSNDDLWWNKLCFRVDSFAAENFLFICKTPGIINFVWVFEWFFPLS